MLLAPLFGAAVYAAIATAPVTGSGTAGEPGGTSTRQEIATADILVRAATACIVHAVRADPRYGNAGTAQLGDIIVDSMPACVTPVRAMIAAYDRFYGDGTGEAFFMGPYLDVLPKAVVEGDNETP